MAKTIPLNNAQTVWVTTYSGGDKGTCFDITAILNDEQQATATFDVEDLIEILSHRGTIRGLAKPEFDQ